MTPQKKLLLAWLLLLVCPVGVFLMSQDGSEGLAAFAGADFWLVVAAGACAGAAVGYALVVA